MAAAYSIPSEVRRPTDLLALLLMLGVCAAETRTYSVRFGPNNTRVDQGGSSGRDSVRSAADRLSENEALLRRLIETTNAGGSTQEFFAPNPRHRQNGRTSVQEADLRDEAMTRRRSVWQGLRREIKQLIAEGNVVAAHVTFYGRHVGEYRGIPATGRQVAYEGVHLYRIANGQIVESSLVSEDFWIIEQLGGVIRPQ